MQAIWGGGETFYSYLDRKSLFYFPERNTKSTFPPQTGKLGELLSVF
jgi:hypothetical protein